MKKVSVLFALFTIVAIAACKHYPDETIIGSGTPGGTGGTTNPHPCDPDTVYFQNTIFPLIVSNCAMAGCHDAVTHAEDVRLYDYAHILQIVEPGDPNSSDLYDELFDGMPPASHGGPLSTTDKNLIRTWILQGALNNSCTEDCDPNAAITFSGVLWPIIENNCTGCHSGSSPSGGVALTNYANVATSVGSGAFMHSLNGTNGVSLMPDNTGGLPACQIDQFQAWVDAGAPNN